MPTTGAEAGDGVVDRNTVGEDAGGERVASERTDDASAGAPRVIDVVAGIVFDRGGGRVLLALRKPGQHQGDRWEFPGGKVEPNESLDAALARELDEEIGIVPTAFAPRRTLEHAYPEKRVRLHFVDVTAFDGEPVGREGQTVRWFGVGDLGELGFPDANRPIVDEIASGIHPGSSGRVR